MLLSFSFSNSLSFYATQELNLLRTPSPELEEPNDWVEQVTPVAAVYGANASGKTNLFSTLHTAVSNITTPDPNTSLRISNRLVSAEEGLAPTIYTFRFIALDDVEYEYGYSVTDDAIIEEHLTRYLTSRPAKVFSRSLSPDTGKITFSYGTAFKGEKKLIEQLVKPEKLYLSASNQLDENPLQHVYEWFEKSVVFHSSPQSKQHASAAERLSADPQLAKTISHYITKADLGISGIELKELTGEAEKRLRADLEKNRFPAPWVEEYIDKQKYRVELHHSNSVGEKVALPFEWESLGTKTILELAIETVDVLESGGILFVDEIDSSLHPLLVRELVRKFISPKTNPRQAQLVFSTHDVTLLKTLPFQEEALARDQIWLVEKNRHGQSELYSIADFGLPRKKDDIFRRYLAGQYGAVPNPEMADFK